MEEAKLDSKSKSIPNENLRFGERALSAGGAAFISAVIVNPLDVVKTRLQAQAAGVPYQGSCRLGCFDSNSTLVHDLRSSSSPGMCRITGSASVCSDHQYKGTLDVFCKIIRQEGFSRLWRGTNASLALAVPTVGIYMPCYDYFRNRMEGFTTEKSPTLTPYVPLVAGIIARSLACISCYPVELAKTRMQAFKGTQRDVKLPGVWKTLVDVINPVKGSSNGQNYRMLWTGLGAQLARDVPFSAICWSILEHTRRSIFSFIGEEPRAGSIIGANFTAGFVAGGVAAAVTCPLDVAKTRRQIEVVINSSPPLRQVH
ncbi:PREDICTED: mitochondrial carrier protein MTM1 isoform X2 [Camelina sativa]|uniref:Mitochondrial carrier protein MTM1 isoform X2 n=1 Tax=Camelina sativa TaxID=90675 RepID=A0ABM0ZNM7_CAMSA|nr:PREDICTED: mitochondrial carrier protein MTM1 isoform X2 [Camelina sativa]